MLIRNEIKKHLENEFHGKFNVTKYSDENEKYIVTIFDSLKQYFEITVNVHDDIRLIVTCTPEKYGASFLSEINRANVEKKLEFVNYWKTIGCDKLNVIINGQKMDYDSFINDEKTWNNFLIKYNEAPFLNENENKVFKICNIVGLICAMVLSLVSFVIEGYEEGKKTEKTINVYERNPLNREICLFLKGYKCSVCGFDFEEFYGEIGHHFIEVHHSIMVSEMDKNHKVIPEKELFPLCSNCHSMIHSKYPPYGVEELRKIVEAKRNESN